MAEITVASLDPFLQKKFEDARAALNRGQPEQAVELCAAVLAVEPDCAQVRKLERAAQLRFAAIRRSLVSKLFTAVSSAPFLIGGTMRVKDDPRSSLATAERLLRRNPHSVAALNLLGESAIELGWTQTAVFAYETASDLEPDRSDLLILLGRAYLLAGRGPDAVSAARQALHLQPENAEAQSLLQKALVAAPVNPGKRAQRGDSRGTISV